MKTILKIFIFCITPLSIFAQRFDVKFSFDGADREFIVVKPSGNVPVGGYPVVFMFHGSSGTGEEFYNNSKWKERGEIEKFITVFPTGLKYCVLNFPDNNPVRITKWNNGNLIEDQCPNVAQIFKDDVRFVRKMVDTIRQTFNVNAKKIFASGFSNGGAMVTKLAMDAPDIFAAVANNGSMLHALDSTKPSRVIPIWTMVGSLDDRFTTPLAVPEIPFGGDSCLAYLKAGLNRILTCEGLSQTYTKNNTARTNTFIFDKSLTSGNTNRYIFTLVDDMTHVFPNGINYPLVAADLHWEFFKQAVATDVRETQLPESAVTIYPNPAQESMTIQLPENTEGGRAELSVFNTFGQQVFLIKNENTTVLNLNKKDIGKGLFILKIKMGDKAVVKRVVFE